MIGVEAELFPSMYNRINGTDMPCAGDTLAEGIAVKEPGGDHRRAWSRRWSTTSCWSANASLEAGGQPAAPDREDRGRGRRRRRPRRAARLSRALRAARPSASCCAAATSTRGCSPTCCCAISPARAASRGCASGCRISPARCSTSRASSTQERVNIIEVYHQRIFTNLPAKGLIIDVECETRDRAHLDRLLAALREQPATT